MLLSDFKLVQRRPATSSDWTPVGSFRLLDLLDCLLKLAFQDCFEGESARNRLAPAIAATQWRHVLFLQQWQLGVCHFDPDVLL